jgi:hypothetical protein
MFQPCKLRRWCYFSLRHFSFANQFEDPFFSKPWISIVFCQICKKKYCRCLWNKNVIGTKENAKRFWKVLLLFCLAKKRLSLLKPWFVLGCYLPILVLPAAAVPHAKRFCPSFTMTSLPPMGSLCLFAAERQSQVQQILESEQYYSESADL